MIKNKMFNTILKQNKNDKELLKQLIDKKITKVYYKAHTSERLDGQWQWGTCSYNIRRSDTLCKHKCVYCYVAPMFERWKKVCKNIDIEEMMPTDIKKVNKNWKKTEKEEMIFFPSSTDTFEENMKEYVSVCDKIIKAGNNIMFVTKPTIKSITRFIEEINKQHVDRTKIIIFITITSDNNEILKMYEPCASTYEERINCIRMLNENSFNVNIMMEPYLSDPIKLTKKIIEEIPNGIIAIGQMNYMKGLHLQKEQVEYLDDLYSKENIKKLWTFVKDNDKLFLKKDSITACIKYLV